MSPGRLWAATVAVLVLAAGLVVVGGSPAPVDAAAMCAPRTLADLPPLPGDRPRSTTPTTTPGTPTTSTTIPETTSTTVETTTTTESPTSTTTPTDVSTTIDSGSSSTTLPGSKPAPRPTPRCTPFVYPLTWPIAGDSQVISSFGDERDGGDRRHAGIDIQAPKLTPVLAASDGTVLEVKQIAGTEECCTIKIRHDDGWFTVYVHLNNDSYLTDDGLGMGVRTDLAVGDEVVAGQVIGWIGDSGNAEDSVNHLHFELRTRQGVAVDPTPTMREAKRRADLPDDEVEWPYRDDDGRAIQLLAGRLLTEGLFLPCDDVGLDFCPEELADPEFARAIARHLTGAEPPIIEGRTEDVPQVFEDAVGDSRVVGELLGCEPTELCLAFGVSESDLGRLAAWAVTRPKDATLANPELVNELDSMGVLPESHEAEATLRHAGMIGECRPPLEEGRLVTREEALTSLVRWILGPTIADCQDISQPVR